MGRVAVITKSGGVASSYDCCACPCPDSYNSLGIDPASWTFATGASWACWANAEYDDCNGVQSYYDVTTSVPWNSSNTTVATVDSVGDVGAFAPGAGEINAGPYSDCSYDDMCYCTMDSSSAGSPGTVDAQVQISAVSISPTTIHTAAVPTSATMSVTIFHEPIGNQTQSVVLNAGTYSSNPQGINGTFAPASQFVTFSAGSPQGTVTMYVTLSVGSIGTNSTAQVTSAATLTNPSSGLTIVAPSPATNGRFTITVDNP